MRIRGRTVWIRTTLLTKTPPCSTTCGSTALEPIHSFVFAFFFAFSAKAATRACPMRLFVAVLLSGGGDDEDGDEDEDDDEISGEEEIELEDDI